MACISMSNGNFPIVRMKYTKIEEEERICTIGNMEYEIHYVQETYDHNLDTLNKIS